MEVSNVTYSIYCVAGSNNPILWLSTEKADVDVTVYSSTDVDADALRLPSYDRGREVLLELATQPDTVRNLFKVPGNRKSVILNLALIKNGHSTTQVQRMVSLI